MQGIVPLFLVSGVFSKLIHFRLSWSQSSCSLKQQSCAAAKLVYFLSCFCCVRHVFDLSGHCNDMQAFLVICPLSKQARQEIDDLKQTLAAKEESDAKAVTFYAGHFPTVFGIRCILQIDSFPAFVVTIFLFPQAAELRSSKTSLFFILFLLCATCLRPFWSLQ